MRSLQVKNAPSSPPLSLIVPFSVEHSSYWTHLRFPCYSVSKTGVKSTTAGSCIPDVQLQAAAGETTEWLEAGGMLVSCHDIAGIWVVFSPSGLHSSQDASDIVADRTR